MTRIAICGALTVLLSFASAGQSPNNAVRFEIADVHPSAKSTLLFARPPQSRGGRYQLRNASMVDLIRFAYGFDEDKILGGPNWLEVDRFDVIAKEPAQTTPDARKLMLQSLLADRFGLALHQDTKPLAAYALTAGKNPRIKQAAGTEETGCRPQTASGAPRGNGRIAFGSPGGGMTTIDLGPGATIQFLCRNITMAAFVEGLPRMMGSSLGSSRVSDATGLKGAWNFDVKWSMQMIGPDTENPGERVTLFDAVEKQLGLKLEARQVPAPVIVVDKVSRTPTANPPGVAEALPEIPVPAEFEVADVKPSEPAPRPGGSFRIQPGGRFVAQGMPLGFLVRRAFTNSLIAPADGIVGMPAWAGTERFDITAKAPEMPPSAPPITLENVAPMIRALLADRFKMTWHTEDRQGSAYSLVSARPKMKKADPDSRASCKNVDAPPDAPPGSRSLSCRNITMAEFVDRLQGLGPGLGQPVLDETGLEGGWDFTLTFGQNFGPLAAPGRGGDAGPGAVPMASDPTGVVTIFDAVQKQLGLKLEPRKRTMPVIVIDHIERQPTDN